MFGNNYHEFEKELDNANIIIYLVDAVNPWKEGMGMLDYLVSLIKKYDDRKYLLTVINKCDNMSLDGTYKNYSSEQKVISSVENILKQTAAKESLEKRILPPLPISSKYANIYRQIAYGLSADVTLEEKTQISSVFAVKKEIIGKDIQRNTDKYFKQCGWLVFRNTLADILNCKYRSMVDYNFLLDVSNLENIPIMDKQLGLYLDAISKKAEKLQKILKKIILMW